MGSALLVVWLLVPQHTFVVFGLFLQTLEMVPLMMCCLSPADSQGLSNAAMVLRRALGAGQRPKVADQPFNMPIVRRIFTSCTPLLLPLPAAGPLLSITVQTCARSDAMHNLKPQPSHRICTRTTTHDEWHCIHHTRRVCSHLRRHAEQMPTALAAVQNAAGPAAGCEPNRL